MNNKVNEEGKGVSEPTVAYSNNRTIKLFGSFDEANEANAKTMAEISGLEHLHNATVMIRKVFAEQLKTAMDKTLKIGE